MAEETKILDQEEFDNRLYRLSHATRTEEAIRIEEGLRNKYAALLTALSTLREERIKWKTDLSDLPRTSGLVWLIHKERGDLGWSRMDRLNELPNFLINGNAKNYALTAWITDSDLFATLPTPPTDTPA